MSYVYLDDGFFENEKVIAVGGDAQLVYIAGLAFTNRKLTGGVIPVAMVPRLTDRRAPHKLAKRLVEGGMWHENGHACPVCPPVEIGNYIVHDYEEMNRSAMGRREKARNAARARYSKHAPSSNGAAVEQQSEQPSSTLPRERARALGPPQSPLPPLDTSSVSPPLLEALRTDDVLHRVVLLLARRHVQREVDAGAQVRNFDAVVSAEMPKQFERHQERLRRWREEHPDLSADELVTAAETGVLPLRIRAAKPAEVSFEPPPREFVKSQVDAARAAVGGQE